MSETHWEDIDPTEETGGDFIDTPGESEVVHEA